MAESVETAEATRLREQAEQWPDPEPARYTPEDRQEVFEGICNGTIFTDRDLPKDDPASFGRVFFPFSAMPPPPEAYARQIGLVWEHNHHAISERVSSTNGGPELPMFMSLKIMHKLDLEMIRPALAEHFDRRDRVAAAIGKEPT